MQKIRIKEGLTIAGVTFGGFLLIVAIAVASRLLADRFFSVRVWPRLLVTGLILLVLGSLLFRYRGKGKESPN
jgi:hypothetical protein